MNKKIPSGLIFWVGVTGLLAAQPALAQPNFQPQQNYQQCVSYCNGLDANQPEINQCLATQCDPLLQSANESANAQHTVADQRTRQVVRQISSYINTRIARDINPEFFGPGQSNPQGASGDGKSLMPDSLWTAFSWSRLNNNGNSNGTFDVDIYQATAGVDKNFGNFYLGTTLNYAGSDDNLKTAGLTGANHTVGVTPYAAYVFNKNFFISGLSGYNYSTTSYQGGAPSVEADAYQTELDLNTLHVIDHWFMKGKVGTRYLHMYSKADAFNGNPVPRAAAKTNLDSWTYLADFEAGYSFDMGLRAFTGILFEHNDSPNANFLFGTNRYTGNNIFYYSAGADYSFSKKLTLGAKVQTDLNNNAVDLTTVNLNMRMWFD